MAVEMTIEQRDQILASMTEEQKSFVQYFLVRGRKTIFARQLAGKKSLFIPEDASMEEIEAYLEEWDYRGYTDAGEVSQETKCECGRPLRYQHQVIHRPTQTIRYLGIDHLQVHTGIDARTINAIIKGFDVLDHELFEILVRYQSNWKLQDAVFQPFPEGFEVPQDIQKHLDVQLPLLDRQVTRLRYKLKEWDRQEEEARIRSRAARIAAITAAAAPPVQAEADLFTINNQQDFPGDEAPTLFDFDFVNGSSPQEPVQLVQSSQPAQSADGGTPSSLFVLPAKAQHLIDQALQQSKHRISARSAAELLIEQKAATDKRMNTGKPEIYIAVCAYLDSLVSQGSCQLLEQHSEDRIYQSIG